MSEMFLRYNIKFGAEMVQKSKENSMYGYEETTGQFE